MISGTIAEFYSRNLSSEVKTKSLQKAKTGGTLGIAPTGYLNVRQVIDGQSKASISVDPERAPFVRDAFEMYASGDFTLRQLTDALARKGLTCRPTAKYPSAPLTLSKVAKILRSPYYVGIVTYNGVQYAGRHEPLISQDLFDAVKDLLNGHGRARERRRSHPHYLKGTIYCRRCRSRLTFMNAKGQHGGIYQYFFCLGRQRRNGRDLPWLPVDHVEAELERIYATRSVTNEQVEELQERLFTMLANERRLAVAGRNQVEKRIVRLERERYTWAEKSVSGAVPDDISREKQDTIGRQLRTARSELNAIDVPYDDAQEVLRHALELVAACDKAYLAADPDLRRQWNQTFFERVEFDADDISFPKFTPLFGALMSEAENEVGRNANDAAFDQCETKRPDLVSVGRG